MCTLFRVFVTLFATLAIAPGSYSEELASESATNPKELIGSVLDDFHLAAAEADRDRYLSHFAENAVFMGTDDWERWPIEAFTEYVEQRFATGGWAYTAESRNISLAPSGTIAWFDELMISERWGRFRGTGVLLNEQGGWKIAHYSLTILIPNEGFAAISEMATSGFEERKSKE
ncbi:MAG: nuclear transport factor 2 family protein [Pseudomonadota bacterium]